MRPFTPRQKDNLAAWMVARNDGAHYGKLAVYRFPRQSLVFGPNQIVNRINQDTEVSRQISLWDQRGSEVLRGELLVHPDRGIADLRAAALSARPGRAHSGAEARGRRAGGRVAMAETLDAALRALFGAARVADARRAAGVDPRAGDSGARAPARAADTSVAVTGRRPNWRARRTSTSSARGRRSAPTTGRRTAPRCGGWARCCASSALGGTPPVSGVLRGPPPAASCVLNDHSTDSPGESDTRDRILFAAMRLFAQKGYGSTSVADILGAAERERR